LNHLYDGFYGFHDSFFDMSGAQEKGVGIPDASFSFFVGLFPSFL
jgi:hypothetical protein